MSPPSVCPVIFHFSLLNWKHLLQAHRPTFLFLTSLLVQSILLGTLPKSPLVVEFYWINYISHPLPSLLFGFQFSPFQWHLWMLTSIFPHAVFLHDFLFPSVRNAKNRRETSRFWKILLPIFEPLAYLSLFSCTIFCNASLFLHSLAAFVGASFPFIGDSGLGAGSSSTSFGSFSSNSGLTFL